MPEIYKRMRKKKNPQMAGEKKLKAKVVALES